MKRLPKNFHPAVCARLRELSQCQNLSDTDGKALYDTTDALLVFKRVACEVLDEIEVLVEAVDDADDEKADCDDKDQSAWKIARDRLTFSKLIRPGLDGVDEVLEAHQHAVTQIISNLADCTRAFMTTV